MTTLAATGVLRASWLLLAFPVFGAAVLLIGGRFTDKWGHLLGCLMSLASFVYGVIAFFTLLSYPARTAAATCTCTPGSRSRGSRRTSAYCLTRCRSASCC